MLSIYNINTFLDSDKKHPHTTSDFNQMLNNLLVKINPNSSQLCFCGQHIRSKWYNLLKVLLRYFFLLHVQYITYVKTHEISLYSQKYLAHLTLWVTTHDKRNLTCELGCNLDFRTGLLETVVPMCVWSQNMGIWMPKRVWYVLALDS